MGGTHGGSAGSGGDAMKPLSLSMTAFGTYKDTTVIDFTALGGEGIFLITGATGAGKTTLFDAICYALFGRTSSQRREAKMLASDFADKKTSPKVELTFQHRGEIYTISREQPYIRHRDGTVEMANVKAALYFPDGRLIDKPTAVTRAVEEEILHLTYEQFKQVVMIAQGEFRALLEADTEQRSILLQKIFQTESYRRLADRLKEKADEAKEAAKESARRIAQSFGEAKAAMESDLSAELVALQEKYAASGAVDSIEEMTAILAKLTEDDDARERTAAAAIAAAETATQAMAASLSQAESMNERLKERDALRQKAAALSAGSAAMEEKRAALAMAVKAVRFVGAQYESWRKEKAAAISAEEKRKEQEARLAAAVAGHEKAQALAEKAAKDRPAIERAEKEAAAMKEQESLYGARAAHQAALEKAQQEMRASGEKQRAVAEARKAVRDQIAAGEAQLSQLSSLREQRAVLRAKAERGDEDHRSARRLTEEEIPACRAAIAAWQEKKNACAAAQTAFDAVRAAHDEMERRFENSRAGMLAEKLTDGTPCPVCGALHHPRPAALMADSLRETDWEKAKAELEAARRKKDEAVRAAQEARSICETLADKLRQDMGAFLDRLRGQGAAPLVSYRGSAKEESSLEALFSLVAAAQTWLQTERASIRREEEACEAALASLQREEKAVQVARERQKELEEEERKTTADRLAAVAAEAAAKASLEALPNLPYDSLESAQNAREEKEQAAKARRDAMERAERDAREAEHRRIEAEAKRDEAIAQAKAQEKTARESEAAFRAALGAQGFTEETFAAHYTDEGDIAARRQAVDDHDRAVTETKSQLAILERQTKDAVFAEVDALSAKLQEKQQTLAKARQAHSAVYSRREQNRAAAERIRGAGAENQERRHRAALLQNVYERISGKTVGHRTSLEEYVQSAGFARIVQAADVRLGDMTGGRFSLLPHEAQAEDDKRKKHGLAIDVLDRYTGRRRSVRTLSGGESFMASLALALGLSDTVTENAGGVVIETLFIDEGFGTLDPEALESAIGMLQGLTAHGKLIGLISHREELKQALSRQIIVEKSSRGSRVRVDTEG
ncbi:MAG: AAA family ATPase [Schwartzia sp. (in: firmicutes)]